MDERENTCKIIEGRKYCNGDIPLKPSFKRAGGKSQISNVILGKIENHKVYTEPFVGGGGQYT